MTASGTAEYLQSTSFQVPSLKNSTLLLLAKITSYFLSKKSFSIFANATFSCGKYFFTYACALAGNWSKRTGRSSSARTAILTVSRQTNRAKIFFILFFFYSSTSYLSNLSTGQISGMILK